MAAHSVAEEEFRRRARRRLMGAVALTILAVIILPQVLDKTPPPVGRLNIEMPAAPESQNKSASTGTLNAPTAAHEQTEVTKPQTAVTPSAPADKHVEPSPARSTETHSDDNGSYSIQIGAFTTPAYVKQSVSRAKSLSLPVYTDRMGNTTRVRVGPFKDRAAAENAADRLKAAGLPNKLDGP
jgi:DedD protein